MPTHTIAQRRLISQRLLGARLTTPSEVVEWLCAVQAQDYAGAKWALGLRLQSATEESIEQAFAAGTILRTHLLRPTWHFITPADIRWLLKLSAPRVHAANAYMYRKLGLDKAVFKRSRAALVKALRDGQQLTRDELRGVFRAAGIPIDGELRMGYLLMHAELDGIVCSGPRHGKRFTYVLLDKRVPLTRTLERDEGLAELARRFFTSRGPATIQDFAKWAGLTMVEARIGLDSVNFSLERQDLDGKDYWFAPTSGRSFRVSSPTAHFLSIYDEYLSGYKDRSAMVAGENAARLSQMGNALGAIVVIDGQVVGTWKRRFRNDEVIVNTQFFRRLSKAENRAVTTATQAYGDFLGMPGRLE